LPLLYLHGLSTSEGSHVALAHSRYVQLARPHHWRLGEGDPGLRDRRCAPSGHESWTTPTPHLLDGSVYYCCKGSLVLEPSRL